MNFNIQSLPYLYHIEYTDNWTHKSKGVFVDPDGNEYRYEDTRGWKPFYEVNQIDFSEMRNLEPEVPPTISKTAIKPEVLFHNLSLCRTKKPFMSWFSKNNKVILPDEIIKDLMTSAVAITSNYIIHDARRTTYSLLVYDIENGCYKQVLLSSTDYRGTKNSSIYTDSLVAKLARL